jgi:aspartyl-tRNA(Asn)/glutamyl-tRNA(Gln) amidotransferase subunit C
LDKTTLTNIAKLARIKVSESEMNNLTNELTNIFVWIEQLNGVNTENIKPMTSVVDMIMPSRFDEVIDGDNVENILQNAPDRPNDGRNFFTVPKVID